MTGLINKKVLKELILRKEYQKLEGFNLRRVATNMISFLYFDEPDVFLFAEGLGYVCGLLEDNNDVEFVKGILRRLFWHLNDESGAYCKGAPIAIGEIGSRCPSAFEGFKNMLVSLLRNEEIELKYVIYAIGVSAENVKSAYPSPVEELRRFLRFGNPEIVAYTIISLKALGEDVDPVEINLSLKEKAKIYCDGKIVEVILGELLNFYDSSGLV